MRILAPASNLTDAVDLINNGADDIYVGASSPVFYNYSYNGRAIRSKNGKVVSPDIDEVQKICDHVHKNDGHVYFLANTPFLYDGQMKENPFFSGFMKYIKNGYMAGADYVVLGDIGSIKLVREAIPDFKIAASSYLEVQNKLAMSFFEEMGVAQVILSYQSTLEDVKELSQHGKMDIEIFGHGGCSFFVGSCNMFHEMGEEPINMGYPCRAVYQIYYDNLVIDTCRVLDSFKMCSLCSLASLMQCNIKSIKIVGRDLEPGYILELVSVYKKAIKLVNAGKDLDKFKTELPVWWKKAWCETGLCKYK